MAASSSAKKRKLAELSVDEFMQYGIDSDSSEIETVPQAAKMKKKKKKTKETTKDEQPVNQTPKLTQVKKHQLQMMSLKEKDPEFYKFLQDEDQELLDFDLSGSDLEEDDEEDSDDDGEAGVHKLPHKLEVASDDSEFESDEEDVVKETTEKQSTLVTLKTVNKWRDTLEDQNSVVVFHDIVKAFKSAVQQTEREQQEIGKYKVEGSVVFNAIVSTCVRCVPTTLLHNLKLKDNKHKKFVLPSSSKKWTRFKHSVQSYLSDVIRLLAQLSEPSIVNVILRHMHVMVPYYACFPKVAKLLIKKLVSIWSTGEETSRVLAFLSIYRLSYNLQESMLEYSLKQMYMGYVRNCKFTSPSVLPMINFMQRSLTEMFAINIQVTYQHAFIYIRQLAIHLRNAITTKKKDTYQAVYNWQYIHCLYLWCRVLSTIQPIGSLQPLIYPLVQITMGAIKLIPAGRYYPLRFHCLRALNLLSEATNTFIPIIPLLLEVFEQTDWNKKHSSISFKPINFAIVLKLSKSQLQERAFKDGLIDQLYDLLMEHLNVHSHCIGFPELALPLIVELKQFLKKCKVVNYCRQMKPLLDKIQENCAVINKRRDATTINLSDDVTVSSWEIRSKQEGTPISNLYKTYKKLRERELKHEEAGKDRLDDHVPYIERKKKKEKDKKEITGLFVSSDEDDSDIETFFDRDDKEVSTNRKKVKKMAVKEEVSENDDDEEDTDDEEDDDETVVKESKEQLQKKHKLVKGDVGDEEDIVEEFELSSEEEAESDDDDDDDDDDDSEEEEEDD